MNISTLKKSLASGDLSKVKDTLYFLLDNPEYDNELVLLIFRFVLSDDRGIRNLAIDCLMNIPKQFKAEASKYIAPLVASDNIELRNIASDILVHYGEVSYEFLKPFLRDPNPDVRQFALDIWGNIGSKQEVDKVIEMLDDNNKNVVISAIIALSNIKPAEVVDLLIEKYNVEEDFKPFVLNALGKIGGEKSAKFLNTIIRNELDPLLQIAAIEAISNIGADEKFVNELLNKLPYVDKPLQSYYLKSICNVAKKTCPGKRIPNHLRTIALESLKEEDIDVRKAALFALGDSYEPVDLDYLVAESLRFEQMTLEIIINNIMQNSEDNILSEYIEKIVYVKNNAEVFPILFEVLYRDWQKYNFSKKITLMTTILSLVDDIPESILNDFCDLFAFFDKELFIQSIDKVRLNSIFANNEKLEEIIQQYGFHS